MCRGLAVCFNYDDGFYSRGVSSHTDTAKNMDDFKLEVIIDDSVKAGYVVEVDQQYLSNGKLDPVVYEMHKDKITAAGKLRKPFSKELQDWVRENETQILRWLLKNTTYAQAKKDQYMRYCEAGENQDMSYCKAGEDQYMGFCKAGENQDMSYCKAGENQDMSYCVCGGERYISYMHGKDKNNNDFIDQLTTEGGGEYDSLTWDYLVRLARKGYGDKRL